MAVLAGYGARLYWGLSWGPLLFPKREPRMDRFAFFVDAGYVYAAGGLLCHGTRDRSRLELNFQKPTTTWYWGVTSCYRISD